MIRFAEHHTKAGVNGHYMVRGGTLVVYCAGSDHGKDWRKDITHAFPRLGPMRLHRYFADGAQWLMKFVKLLARRNSIDRIILAGHSYGGSVVEIAGYFLTPTHAVSIVTYGAPKSGGKHFYKHLYRNTDITHYRNRGDVVPFFPPWPWYRGRKNTTKLGKLTWPWKAHGPKTYHEQMYIDGVRHR